MGRGGRDERGHNALSTAAALLLREMRAAEGGGAGVTLSHMRADLLSEELLQLPEILDRLVRIEERLS